MKKLKKLLINSKLILLILSLSLALPGCDIFRKKLEISTNPINITTAQPPYPRPLELEDIYFYVVTAENLNEFLTNWKRNNGNDFVFIAISVKDYEGLALNLEELRRYINQQREIIIYYKKITSNEKATNS